MHLINATLVNLYQVCRRECWLHAHAIRMEHTSDTVYEGKLIGENTYEERAERNTQLELTLSDESGAVTASAKIDYYDPKTRTVHETKKSDKMEHAHVAQVKFYLYLLLKNGVGDAQGIIEYPRLRERTQVALGADGVAEVERWLDDIRRLLEQDHCPPVLNKPVCRSCSYQDFCYTAEQ